MREYIELLFQIFGSGKKRGKTDLLTPPSRWVCSEKVRIHDAESDFSIPYS
jgi:hypothetical protein